MVSLQLTQSVLGLRELRISDRTYLVSSQTMQLFSNHNGEVTQITSSDGPHMFETNGFYWQLRQFLENLLQGKKSPDDLFSVLETMRLTDCIRLRQAHYMA